MFYFVTFAIGTTQYDERHFRVRVSANMLSWKISELSARDGFRGITGIERRWA